MGNAVVHFELMSREPEKVSGFYAKVFTDPEGRMMGLWKAKQ